MVSPHHLKNLLANPDSSSKDIPIRQDDSLHAAIKESEHYEVAQNMLQKYNPSKIGEVGPHEAVDEGPIELEK